MRHSIQKYFHYYDVAELEQLRALYGDGELGERPQLASVYSAIRHRSLPERYPEVISQGTIFCEAYHKAIVQSMGCALLAKSWLRPLAEYIGGRPCLEVMAGTGALAWALGEYGVPVLPTDNYSLRNTFARHWVKVRRMDALRAVKKYGRDVDFVILSWPFISPLPGQILTWLREHNPRCRMIYLGEWRGGCNVSDDFCDLAREDPAAAELVARLRKEYQSWYDLKDTIYILQ